MQNMVSPWPIRNNKSMEFPTLFIITTLLLLLVPSISSSQYLGSNNNNNNNNNNVLTTHRKILPIIQDDSDNSSYAVIFDAGSSGTRVHVFHFDRTLNLLHIGNDLEFYDKIVPGLSAYADNPEEAAESLIPLVDEAQVVIPQDLHRKTPVRLGATAGLRLLDGDASEKILQAVRDLFNTRSNFSVQADAVTVIDGTQEGSYLWVAVNYLLGKLGKKHSKTVGVVDLGGASVQMAYAVTKNTAKNAPKVPEGEDPYIRNIALKGKKYYVYVHSYLRYGADAARAEILKITDNSANPCILSGFDGIYKYSGAEYKAFAPASGSEFDECREIVLEALNVSALCPHHNCTFGGIWNGGGGSGQKNLIVATSFYYLASEVGFIDPNKPNSIVRPLDYKNAAEVACKIKFEEAQAAYPLRDESRIPYVCMDLTYQYTLLVDGFGLDPLQEITVAQQIEHQDARVEVAWPLGSAIEAISSLPKFEKLMYFI